MIRIIWVSQNIFDHAFVAMSSNEVEDNALASWGSPSSKGIRSGIGGVWLGIYGFIFRFQVQLCAVLANTGVLDFFAGSNVGLERIDSFAHKWSGTALIVSSVMRTICLSSVFLVRHVIFSMRSTSYRIAYNSTIWFKLFFLRELDLWDWISSWISLIRNKFIDDCLGLWGWMMIFIIYRYLWVFGVTVVIWT